MRPSFAPVLCKWFCCHLLFFCHFCMSYLTRKRSRAQKSGTKSRTLPTTVGVNFGMTHSVHALQRAWAEIWCCSRRLRKTVHPMNAAAQPISRKEGRKEGRLHGTVPLRNAGAQDVTLERATAEGDSAANMVSRTSAIQG
ncbi:hypothetical protein K438DRAFT_1760516 [Mycena galopus ATCC 62051]|nr:hypothetical protein K438DRAFT_1760516 [Mycena galopus ATCC 62051]